MSNKPDNGQGRMGSSFANFRNAIDNLYDFLPNDLNFSTNTSGAGQKDSFKIAGIHGSSRCEIAGAASANDYARVTREHGDDVAVEIGIGTYLLDIISYIELLPNIGAFTDTFVGIFNSKNGLELDDAISFFYDESHTNWQCITRKAATETITDSGVALTNATKYNLKIRLNAAGTSAKFFINKTLVATHTTDIPSVFMTIGHYVRTTANHSVSGNVSHVLDAMREKQRFTVSR